MYSSVGTIFSNKPKPNQNNKEKKMKRNKKKSNNKGFSLVELIIVIAIMAILSGALAPQLIKYLDKSRKATDVQTAQTIATAVNAAMANEAAYNAITDNASYKVSELTKTSSNAFIKEVAGILGSNPAPKFSTSSNTDFHIVFTGTGDDKTFKIYAGGVDVPTDTAKPGQILYPTVGTNYK